MKNTKVHNPDWKGSSNKNRMNHSSIFYATIIANQIKNKRINNTLQNLFNQQQKKSCAKIKHSN